MKKTTIIILLIILSFSAFSQACFSTGKRITFPENSVTQKVIAFDVDSDGDKDIISTGGSILYWYENDGNMNFETRIEIPFSHGIEHICFSNNSNDSYPDILISDTGPEAYLYHLINDGIGNFTEALSNVIANGVNFANKDINGDELSEVITINRQNPESCMWDGYETWEFSAQGEFQNNNFTCSDNLIDFIYLFDIDNDMDNDLIYPFTFSPGIILKLNDGAGNFGTADTIILESTINSTLSFGDIDGDLHTDIISFIENKIVWYKNDGANNFSTQNLIYDFGNNNYFNGIYPVDIDGDNDIDIVSNTENNVVYYENIDGNGTFGSENIICTLNTIRNIFLTDIDEDNDMDLLIASFDGTYLFENNPEVIITIQPENINAVEGDNVLISLEADGNDLLYQWQLNDVNISNGGNITGADSSVLSINPASLSDAGNYKCHIVGDCNEIYSNEVLLNVASSSISSINNISFNVYPNPTSSVIYISSKNNDEFDLTLTDVMGKIVFADSFSGNQNRTIDLTNTGKGVYFIVFKTEESIISKKIILK